MGGQSLLVLIGLKVLVMMTLLQNIVISGAQGLLMLTGSKFLIKMTRPQNVKIKGTMFCCLVIFIKIFYPINSRRSCAPEITMLCSEVIMTKLSNLSKPEGLGCLFDFTSFSARPVLALGSPFLQLGCFWLAVCYIAKSQIILTTYR